MAPKSDTRAVAAPSEAAGRPAPAVTDAEADAEPVAPLDVPIEPPVVLCAGGVAGLDTPDGQCQWSPWGSQLPVGTGWPSPDEVVCWAGGVVGLGTPEGQCQWSPCGSQLPVTWALLLAGADVCAGGVVGFGTPDGQCQWSP